MPACGRFRERFSGDGTARPSGFAGAGLGRAVTASITSICRCAEDARPLRHPRSPAAVLPVAPDLHVHPRAAAVMEDLEKLVAKGVPWGTAGRIILLPDAAGAGPDDSDGAPGRPADRPRAGCPATARRWRSWPAASAPTGCCGRSWLAGVARRRDLYVMIGRSRTPIRPSARSLRHRHRKKVESDIRPRVFFEDFPNWVLYPRDEPQGGGGWKDVLVANTTKPPDATDLYLARAAGWCSTRSSGRSSWC